MTDTAAQGAPRPAPADPAAPETQMKASMRYLRRHLREFGIEVRSDLPGVGSR